jgi:uncharacterized damage-inducible protein DinB
MKDLLLIYMKYTQKSNSAVINILDGISEDARNENRKSYYKSLSGLASHNLGSILFCHSIFRTAMPASKKLKATEGFNILERNSLSAAEWSELKKIAGIADQTTVDFVDSLTESDLIHPIKIDWFGGNPEAVPLYYLLSTFVTHGIHHRGQISQILDEIGIDNDFSGIDVRLL